MLMFLAELSSLSLQNYSPSFLLAISQGLLSALKGPLKFLVMWPSPNIAAHFFKTNNVSLSLVSYYGIIYNVIMGVTPYHFCHIR